MAANDFEIRLEKVKELVKKEFEGLLNKPFIVSIMGQTGVGKSSLLNALFKTHLKTDAIRPCTKEIERVVIKGNRGYELWFYDMPGIGESDAADTGYLSEYKQKLGESDVVLWAIHADNRSVAFEQEAFKRLLDSTDKTYRVRLMSKICFVLTKVDLLSPPAWVFYKTDESGFFSPRRVTQQILEQKESYYQDVFLRPYADSIISQTFNDSGFDIEEAPFVFDEQVVYYRGFLDREKLASLSSRFPKHQAVFARLNDNYRVVPCSALFKYNLQQLMLIVINKLGYEAVGRFQNFYQGDELNQVSLAKAKEYCNLVICDPNNKRVLFDLTNIQL